MRERFRRAFGPFILAATGIGAILSGVALVRDYQTWLGWPLVYWLAAAAVIGIGALAWRLYDFQRQLDELAETAPEPPPNEAEAVPTNQRERIADGIRTLRREHEWAAERLYGSRLRDPRAIENYDKLEADWRWGRVVPAMERARCPRHLIAAFSDGPDASRTEDHETLAAIAQHGDEPVNLRGITLHHRLNVLREAIDEADAQLGD